MITDTASLEAFRDSLNGDPYITVDTEFLRERSYWPELCLIQIATPEKVALVDPLSEELDLAPFFALMRDPSIVKVFHAPRQDIEILWNLDECIPSPLFDTQAAAMALGIGESVAYHTLVKLLLKRDLDKTQQYTDWSRRPLSEAQLRYAADDVIYLCGVYEKLLGYLKERNREHWVEEEIAAHSDPDTYKPDAENAWQRIRHQLKKPVQLAAVKALAAWREEQADIRNHTRQNVLRDEQLIEIAKQLPQDLEELFAVRNLRRMSDTTGNAITSLIRAIVSADPSSWPNLPKRPDASAESDLVAMLSLLLKARCREEEVASKLVATRAELEAIAMGKTGIPAMRGWRYELFGRYAEALLQGGLSLSWNKKAIVFQECKS